MAVDQKLLEILACPNCQGEVEYLEAEERHRVPGRVRLPLPGARRHPRHADRRSREAVSTPVDLDDLDADTPGSIPRTSGSRRTLRRPVSRGLGDRDRSAQGLPDADGVDSIVRARHGRLRGLGRRGPEPSSNRGFRSRSGRSRATARCRNGSGATRWCSPCRTRATPRRRSPALEEAHHRGSRVVAVSVRRPSGESWRREYGIAHVEIPDRLAAAGIARLSRAADPRGPRGDGARRRTCRMTSTRPWRCSSDIAKRCHRERPGRRESGEGSWPAKLHGKVPSSTGATGSVATAAYRFKCDLNEYAKTPAFWNVLPELDHNEIVGWGSSPTSPPSSFVPVLLRDPEEHRPRRTSIRDHRSD